VCLQWSNGIPCFILLLHTGICNAYGLSYQYVTIDVYRYYVICLYRKHLFTSKGQNTDIILFLSISKKLEIKCNKLLINWVNFNIKKHQNILTRSYRVIPSYKTLVKIQHQKIFWQGCTKQSTNSYKVDQNVWHCLTKTNYSYKYILYIKEYMNLYEWL